MTANMKTSSEATKTPMISFIPPAIKNGPPSANNSVEGARLIESIDVDTSRSVRRMKTTLQQTRPPKKVAHPDRLVSQMAELITLPIGNKNAINVRRNGLG